MSTYTELDLAYIAGLLDGEGCIHIGAMTTKRGSLSYALTVNVANTFYPVLEFVRDRLGGVISPQRKDFYQLIWCSKLAQEVLLLLLPYLIIKRELAELSICFQDIINSKQDRCPLSDVELEVRKILYVKSRELKK